MPLRCSTRSRWRLCLARDLDAQILSCSSTIAAQKNTPITGNAGSTPAI